MSEGQHMNDVRVDVEGVEKELFHVTIRGRGAPRRLEATRDIDGLLEVEVGECSAEEQSWRVQVLATKLADAGERFRIVRTGPAVRLPSTDREQAVAELRRRGYTFTSWPNGAFTVDGDSRAASIGRPEDLIMRAAGYAPGTMVVLATNVAE